MPRFRYTEAGVGVCGVFGEPKAVLEGVLSAYNVFPVRPEDRGPSEKIKDKEY